MNTSANGSGRVAGGEAALHERGRWFLALAPVAITAGAAPLAAATGLTRASFLGTVLEDAFWSFFFVSYPFFLFAVVYGTARLILLGSCSGPRRVLRLVLLPMALVLFLAACLYPTFGGLVLRAGFAAGGIAFVRGQPASLSLMFGAAVASLAFALALGGASLMLRRIRPFRTEVRGSASNLAALIYAGIVLGAAQNWLLPGTRAWPMVPLATGTGWQTALVLTLAFLPHAVVTHRAVA